MLSALSQRFNSRRPLWGLRLAPRESVRARVIELRWRWPVVVSLAATTPAFYAELLATTTPPLLAGLAYCAAALVTGAALAHTAWRSGRPLEHVLANPLDLALVPGLLLSAVLPASLATAWALWLRLGVALLSVVRMLWALQRLITRGGLGYMLVMAGLILVLCGLGYRWLEPTTPTLGEGLWLAFATAATVGYGDVYPTTTASKIFSFFVVLLGFGVLTMVTAAIAVKWVETEERIIEREILRDMHRQMDSLRLEVVELRRELKLARLRDEQPFLSAAGPPPDGSEREPV